jgi:SPP1 gp7 family putative phage head morphogenesis protein
VLKFSIAELIARAGVTRQLEVTLAPIVPPVGLERDVLALYLRVVREWGRLVPERVLPEYGRTIAEGVRDAPADVEESVEETSAALNRLVLALGPALEDWVVRVEQWHRGRMTQLFTPVGVRLDTLLGRGDVATTLEAVLAENVALIRSLNEQMRNGISGAVFRGLTNRSTARDVAREIREATKIARRRAELIAADQLQKLTGRLDQERQQQLGINEFEWAHSGKKHPRKHHVARNGLRFKWNSLVGRTDPPGRAIRCGCRARAVVKL